MKRQGIVLAGGASRRMGTDKASLLINGETLLARIVRELQAAGYEPVVLGGACLPGCRFIPDDESGSGPLNALRGFAPQEGLVFVASCDLPHFSRQVPAVLEALLRGHQAVVPVIEGRSQPLCSLYRSSCWQSLMQEPGASRVMQWIDRLDAVFPAEEDLTQTGGNPLNFRSANTPEELQALLALGE